jgi:hypothetical protein
MIGLCGIYGVLDGGIEGCLLGCWPGCVDGCPVSRAVYWALWKAAPKVEQTAGPNKKRVHSRGDHSGSCLAVKSAAICYRWGTGLNMESS